MQRKIGEVFDCTLENGEVVSLQVIEAIGGSKCFFNGLSDCKFTSSQRGDCSGRGFIKVENHEPPETDKEKQQRAKKMLLDLAQESDTFNSQQEIWRYLSESEENKVCRENGDIFSFYNGVLYIKNKTQFCPVAGCEFNHFNQWKKYTPPKTITVNGVEIEAPLRSLEGVDVVYTPCFHWEEKFIEDDTNSTTGQTAFKNNMAFATPQAAIACHDAMLKGIIIPQY